MKIDGTNELHISLFAVYVPETPCRNGLAQAKSLEDDVVSPPIESNAGMAQTHFALFLE